VIEIPVEESLHHAEEIEAGTGRFRVLESKLLVPNIHSITVEAPEVARAVKPGEFVIVRPEENGERIPLSVSDFDTEKGTVTMIFMNAGRSTSKLAGVREGKTLPTVAGPLGNPFEIKNYGSVMLVGGCYGIGSIYPVARALKEAGNKVYITIEARYAYLFYWEEKLRNVSDELFFITRDGSQGYRGHVKKQLPKIIKTLDEELDLVVINGCNFLLRYGSAATEDLEIKTMVSLNTLMIDGTGMCGVCRLTVDGETKFACVDGPYFDGHQVDWKELLQRRKSYIKEETVSLKLV
jgi:ferredoxin--NADP+ reductase